MRVNLWKFFELMGRRLILAAGLSFIASTAMADFERRDIEFNADGTTLRGWFYMPANAKGPVPTIVMAHGWSAVKEMWLDKYAEEFANAGMAALVYDNRNFRASDGTPRYEIDRYGVLAEYEEAPRSLEQLEAEYYSYYRLYHPLEIQALSGELAALHEGDTDAVLQFADNYGLLGYGCLKGPLQELTEPEPLSYPKRK